MTESELQKWLEFTKLAKKLMEADIPDTSYKNHIQLYHDAALGDETHIYFYWSTNSEVNIKINIWNKQFDYQEKFEDPVNSLKYIGKPDLPTIEFREQKVGYSVITKIISLINGLEALPNQYKQEGLSLDGESVTLSFSVNGFEREYTWSFLPEEWESLELTKDEIIGLKEKIVNPN